MEKKKKYIKNKDIFYNRAYRFWGWSRSFDILFNKFFRNNKRVIKELKMKKEEIKTENKRGVFTFQSK